MKQNLLFDSGMIGDSVALGALADDAIFGLEEYLKCRRNKIRVNERTTRLVNRGIKLIKILQDGLDNENKQITIDKLDNWKAIYPIRQLNSKICDIILDKNILDWINGIFLDIVKGCFVTKNKILEIEKRLTLISGLYLQFACAISESKE